MLRPFQRVGALLLSASLTLASCGGGGSSSMAGGSGVGSGGTGSYTNGPISGLGSIIVNNIRYTVADGSTTVIRDDDTRTGTSVSELKLGMVVEVTGSKAVAGSTGNPDTASATQVRYGSALIGPVSAVGTLVSGRPPSVTVLGQTVAINSKTVLPAAGLVVGHYVEVHGLINSSNVLTATLIDDLGSTMPAFYKITGTVQSLNTNLGTFLMGQSGNVSVSYAGGVSLPEGLVEGSVAKVWLDASAAFNLFGNVAAPATRIKLQATLASDSTEARLEGEISKVNAGASQIRVNGVTVDTSRATVSGSVTSVSALQEDQRVQVTGAMSGGVLVATQITVLAQGDVDSDEVELHGQIAAMDTSSTTFVLREVVVNYGTAQVTGGTLSGAGATCVEAKGRGYNGLGQLIATEVEVQNCGQDD